jgi:hypothetical protein
VQFGWSEVALISYPDVEQATCSQSGFPSDFQTAIANVNITVTFMRQMDGTELGTKSVLTLLANYSRSMPLYIIILLISYENPNPFPTVVVTCIDDPDDLRNFFIWVDEVRK